MNHLPQALSNLPWLAHLPVALALIAGVILWLAGRAVIRPVTILVGIGLGGLLGFLILPVVMPTLAISPYLGLLGGAASGLTTALLLYKVATAVTFGSAIGAGCGVTAAAVLGSALVLPAASQLDNQPPLPPDPPHNPGQLGGGEQPVYLPPPPVWNPSVEPLPEPEEGPEGADVEKPGVIRAKPVVKPRPKPVPVKAPVEQAARPTRPKPASAAGKVPPHPAGLKAPTTHKVATGEGGEPARQGVTRQSGELGRGASNSVAPAVTSGAVGQVRQFWQAARSSWSAWWEGVPSRDKPWIIGSTVVGVGVGTLLGILLPAWAAGGATALAGSAIWLPCALWLGTAMSLPGIASVRGLSTGGWIAVWLTVAVLGVACQWYGLIPANAVKGKGKKRKGKVEEEE